MARLHELPEWRAVFARALPEGLAHLHLPASRQGVLDAFRSLAARSHLHLPALPAALAEHLHALPSVRALLGEALANPFHEVNLLVRDNITHLPDVHDLVADNLHALPALQDKLLRTYTRDQPELKSFHALAPFMLDNPFILTVRRGRGRGPPSALTPGGGHRGTGPSC